jgi:hypothetical protein
VPEQSAPLAELASLEWAFTLAFDALAGQPLTLQSMATLAPEEWPELRVKPTPSLQWLECRFNSLALWRSVKEQSRNSLTAQPLEIPQVLSDLAQRTDLQLPQPRSAEATCPQWPAQRWLEFRRTVRRVGSHLW